jgi:hypothetical protein
MRGGGKAAGRPRLALRSATDQVVGHGSPRTAARVTERPTGRSSSDGAAAWAADRIRRSILLTAAARAPAQAARATRPGGSFHV